MTADRTAEALAAQADAARDAEADRQSNEELARRVARTDALFPRVEAHSTGAMVHRTYSYPPSPLDGPR